MDMVFNKIVVVSLCDFVTKDVANALSQNLGMMFCDTKDLMEYELVDVKAIENLCSKEFLEQSEKKVIKHIASFENVVVSINFDYLIHNLNIIKENSILVFLKLTKKFVEASSTSVDAISFADRNKQLEQIANVTIPLKKIETNFACKKIIDAIGRIL